MENSTVATPTQAGPDLKLITRTVKVMVRHSSDCKDINRGSEWRRCNCSKSLLIYDGGAGKNRRISAKTRSWEKAEKFAQEYLDTFDSDKQELKRFREAKEREQIRIEEAVALFIADMTTRLSDNGTVRMARSMFGHIDPVTKAITSNGRLFDWLDTLPASQRPTFISEISPTHLTEWRSAWNFGSDLTAAQRWQMVKGFFVFCESQGWIQDSPARKLKRLTADKGNRTAIFSDEQYAEILDAVFIYDPDNVPELTRTSWQQRLTTFIELLRWSGMAIIDAVQYRPESIDADGVLRYRRQKTDELATVPLPEPLLALLRDVPLERDSVGTSQPFRTKDTAPNSDTRKWQHRLGAVFTLAGIKSVRTERGTDRKPHPHMFRDTFAVWHLKHGAKLRTVSKMLGHSKTTTTERAYLPWVKELEDAHIADARTSLAHGISKPNPNKVRTMVRIRR
jgi:integrase